MNIKNIVLASLLTFASLEMQGSSLNSLGYTGPMSAGKVLQWAKADPAYAYAALQSGLPFNDAQVAQLNVIAKRYVPSQPQSSSGGASSEESSDLSGDDAQAAVLLSRAQSTRSAIKSQLAQIQKNPVSAKSALPSVATHMSHLQSVISEIEALPATDNQQFTLGQAQEIWVETIPYANEIRRLAALAEAAATEAGGAAAHIGGGGVSESKGGAGGWTAVPAAPEFDINSRPVEKSQEDTLLDGIANKIVAASKKANINFAGSLQDKLERQGRAALSAGGAPHRSKTLGRLGKDKIKKHTKKAKATKRNQYA